jgi:four helix bundle protein
MASNHWKELIVWKRAHSLTLDLYTITSTFPESERYNLTSQIRRASTSIATNIVEGHDRSTSNDLLRFLYISRGSLEEVRYLILLSKDLNFIDEKRFQLIEKQCSEISIMLNRLIKSLKKTNLNTTL